MILDIIGLTLVNYVSIIGTLVFAASLRSPSWLQIIIFSNVISQAFSPCSNFRLFLISAISYLRNPCSSSHYSMASLAWRPNPDNRLFRYKRKCPRTAISSNCGSLYTCLRTRSKTCGPPRLCLWRYRPCWSGRICWHYKRNIYISFWAFFMFSIW